MAPLLHGPISPFSPLDFFPSEIFISISLHSLILSTALPGPRQKARLTDLKRGSFPIRSRHASQRHKRRPFPLMVRSSTDLYAPLCPHFSAREIRLVRWFSTHQGSQAVFAFSLCASSICHVFPLHRPYFAPFITTSIFLTLSLTCFATVWTQIYDQQA